MAVDGTTPQFDKPAFMNYNYTSQVRDGQFQLMHSVLSVLSETIGDQQWSKEAFYRPSVLGLIYGDLDFVLGAPAPY